MIFMGVWVIVNWWVQSVPDFHFRKLEAMWTLHTDGAQLNHLTIYICPVGVVIWGSNRIVHDS